MKVLTLNTQKAYQPSFSGFFEHILSKGEYDFLLLQEMTPAILEDASQYTEYEILNMFDPEYGENTGVAVIYKKNFVLKDTTFVSFAVFNENIRRGWGFLGGVFSKGEESIFIGSLHLHPGFNKKRRMKQVRQILELISSLFGKHTIVIGGDFNAGFKSEITEAEKIFGNKMLRITKGLGPTLDSHFTEKVPFGVARIANLLAKLGISIKLRADHVYVDKETAQRARIQCRLLSDRVSDHLAIETEIVL